jgi:hypothetical protein
VRILWEEASILEGNIKFFHTKEVEVRAGLQKKTEPAHVIKGQYARIWSPKNWIISQGVNEAMYEKYPDILTDRVGWRILSLWQQTKASFKNGLYSLFWQNWVQGPLGIKAMLSTEAFPNMYKLVPETGEVVLDENSKTETLISRLVAVENSVAEARAAFEATPDNRFISKDIRRPFNVLWHSIIRRFTQSAAILGLQTTGFLANTTATTSAILAPVWAPLWALAVAGYKAMLLDKDGAQVNAESFPLEKDLWEPILNSATKLDSIPVPYKMRLGAFLSGAGQKLIGAASAVESSIEQAWDAATSSWVGKKQTTQAAPLPNEIVNRMLISGVGQITAATTRALWNAGIFFAEAGTGLTRSLAEKTRDMISRVAFWLGGAQVPAVNSTLVTERIKGSGIPGTFNFKFSTESALGVLLTQMELSQLALYEKGIQSQIEIPEQKAADFVKAVPTALGVSIDNRNDTNIFWRPILDSSGKNKAELERKVSERKKTLVEFTELLRSKPIRMTEASLERAIKAGAVLCQLFYESRIFPTMTADSITAFWKGLKTYEGNWIEVSKHLLVSVFGSEFLTPLEKSGVAFNMEVAPKGFEETVRALVLGAGLDVNSKPLPKWTLEPKIVRTMYPFIDSRSLCQNTLAAYGTAISGKPNGK